MRGEYPFRAVAETAQIVGQVQNGVARPNHLGQLERLLQIGRRQADLSRRDGAARGLEAVFEGFEGQDLPCDALADLATEINSSVENIGARRLHTVLEKLLEEISFTATDRGGETVVIDKEMVHERVAELAKNADLSKFIL